MPQDPKHIALAWKLDRFDQLVTRGPTSGHQITSQLVDALVVV